MNRILRNIFSEPPLRFLLKAALTNSLARHYAFESAALFDAVPYPAYAVGLQVACKYAAAAGAEGFTAIEFGVAGGNGLCTLCEYAEILSRGADLRIKVAGFDGGSGLPPRSDYRDAPWLWNAGDFPCDTDRLRAALPRDAELVIGPIEETFPRWLEQTCRLPIGFASVDVDYYSSTAAICETIGRASVSSLLPFVSFYFDDLIRYLTPACVGELAAITEFNRMHDRRKFDRNDWLADDRPYGERLWLKRMYSLCCFDHPATQCCPVRGTERLDLVEK